jgi:putative DNA methylase
LYAKLVLRQDGVKEYLAATENDLESFEDASARLRTLNLSVPHIPIEDGHNTRQVLNFGYKYWHEFFNARQLLALSVLAGAIQDLPLGTARDLFVMLFSGVLEFNNMFATYKGEGTGAVRHMFSHHILKPERMPIEANVWGTPKSSGSFSTLYRSRILRALDYKESPFEVGYQRVGRTKRGVKVFGVSPPISAKIISTYPKNGLREGMVYLSCGDSANTDIPDCSVDLVITDPPFFDNVHYSELADFFFVWQELFSDNRFAPGKCTTRRPEEVQDTDPELFAMKLTRVFQECHRVLRPDGLMAFSYHHSREEGWLSLARAVLNAGFSIVQSQPVKSEMSCAAPKRQTSQPIDIDVFLVCRKSEKDKRERLTRVCALTRSEEICSQKVKRFNQIGRHLSRKDVLVILLSQLLVELSAGRSWPEMNSDLPVIFPRTQEAIQRVWALQSRSSDPSIDRSASASDTTEPTLFPDRL